MNRLKEASVHISVCSRPSAVLTAPALLSSVAGAGTDGVQVFLLPLVSNMVHFPIVITCRLMGFTFEFSLAIAQTGAAHHVTILSLAVPLLADAVVVIVVVTPLG